MLTNSCLNGPPGVIQTDLFTIKEIGNFRVASVNHKIPVPLTKAKREKFAFLVQSPQLSNPVFVGLGHHVGDSGSSPFVLFHLCLLSTPRSFYGCWSFAQKSKFKPARKGKGRRIRNQGRASALQKDPRSSHLNHLST
jgi:hypothetical protein